MLLEIGNGHIFFQNYWTYGTLFLLFLPNIPDIQYFPYVMYTSCLVTDKPQLMVFWLVSDNPQLMIKYHRYGTFLYHTDWLHIVPNIWDIWYCSYIVHVQISSTYWQATTVGLYWLVTYNPQLMTKYRTYGTFLYHTDWLPYIPEVQYTT